MRFCASLLSFAILILAACGRQDAVDYGFIIRDVFVSHHSQSLNVHLRSELELSQQAREALQHGVTLTVVLEMTVHGDNNKVVVELESNRYQMRYLPLSERYQVSEEVTGDSQTYPRLRHLLAAFNQLDAQLSTGPLPTGDYELHTRIRLDESRLPAPMQLPAWLSPQWQHDSDWSVWPFKVNV